MCKVLVVAIFSLCFIFSAGGLESAYAESSQPLDVNVKNFPETQQIKGVVSIKGTTSHAKFFKTEGILVSPCKRNELSELTFVGIVETDGFTSISVNVQGDVKSGTFSSGTIGALLIPDEEPILRALREAKRVQFPIESMAEVKGGGSNYFESEPTQRRIAFPAYRLYLYNTINKSVETNVYLYLTN